MTLNGYDIANVNGPGAIDRAIAGSFVILKASEGTGFHDGYHDGWTTRLRNAGKLTGHYHYAHLGNSPIAEANWFVQCAHPGNGETMWLDFEPYGQPVQDSSFPGWAIAFMDRVNALVPGVSCGIYLNDDMGGRMMAHATPAQAARLHQAPLWKARYASTVGSLLGWANVTMWQFGGTGIDADTLYGDANTWRVLGAGHTGVTPSTPQDGPHRPVAQDAPPPAPPAPPALTGDDMLGYLFRCSDGRVVFVGVSGVTKVANTTDLATLYAQGFGYGPKQEAINANKVWSAADPGPFDMLVKQQGGLEVKAVIESKVWAASFGGTAGTVVGSFLLWLLGAGLWHGGWDAVQAQSAQASVPSPVASLIPIVLTFVGAFVGGFMAPHTVRPDLPPVSVPATEVAQVPDVTVAPSPNQSNAGDAVAAVIVTPTEVTVDPAPQVAA